MSAHGEDVGITINGVSKWFFKNHERIVAVDDVSFAVAPGAFVSLVGPSGCGKSTILNCVAGLEQPDAGEIVVDRPAKGSMTDVAYMTQRDSLMPWHTVLDNVAFPLRLRGVGRRPRREAARRWLDRVGLSGFTNHYPHELSGGMLKRAALARTLIAEPRAILMDEPFANVDAQLKLQLQRELLDLWETERRTLLFVTHDLEEAIVLSDVVVVLSARPGRIVDVIDIELPRPRDAIAGRFEPAFQSVHRHLYESAGLVTGPSAAAAE